MVAINIHVGQHFFFISLEIVVFTVNKHELKNFHSRTTLLGWLR